MGRRAPGEAGRVVTPQREDAYADLTREQLIARLKVAEDVCVLTGWTGFQDVGDRSEAALQMWMMWAGMVGDRASDPDTNVALDRMVPQLATARRNTRAATLHHFFGPDHGGSE